MNPLDLFYRRLPRRHYAQELVEPYPADKVAGASDPRGVVDMDLVLEQAPDRHVQTRSAHVMDGEAIVPAKRRHAHGTAFDTRHLKPSISDISADAASGRTSEEMTARGVPSLFEEVAAGEPTGTVRLRGVRVQFGEILALDGIEFTIPARARVGVVGPSGCGKSTLLSVIAGLLEPAGGEVAVGGATASRARLARCTLMPQKDLLLPWRTALDNACLALENRGLSREKARQRARPLFGRFGLSGFESKRPAQLSGGMRQRVAFLRTLMAEKDVLLLDEPFGALDSITRSQMQEWLASALEQEPRTVLFVTHDVEEALLLCQRVFVMSPRPGRVVREIEVSFPRLPTRRETVTSPQFSALKEQALEALEC